MSRIAPTLLGFLITLFSTPGLAQEGPQRETAPDLKGTWDVQYRSTTEWTLPVIGKTRQQIRVSSHWSIKQEGLGFTVNESICSLEFHHSSPLLKFSFNEKLAQHLSGQQYTGRLRRGDAGWFIQTDSKTRHSGYVAGKTLERELETIPETDWVDADGDGFPGLTIRLQGVVQGDLTALQRDTIRFEGKWNPSPPSVEGVVDWRWTRRLLASSTDKIDFLPEETWVPVLESRKFQMHPTAPGATRCGPGSPSP